VILQGHYRGRNQAISQSGGSVIPTTWTNLTPAGKGGDVGTLVRKFDPTLFPCGMRGQTADGQLLLTCEFLTVPDWVYRRMVEGSGQPDRRLIDYYREIGPRWASKPKFITRILGVDVICRSRGASFVPASTIRPSRSRCWKRFAHAFWNDIGSCRIKT